MLRPVLAVLALVVLGACTTGSPEPEPTAEPSASVSSPSTTPPASSGRYVALGDSYASGPGIPTITPESGFCLRSDHAYPALLAERIGASDFVDVSCAGAGTQSVTTGVNGGIAGSATPPQLDAVTPDTELVTITIGGNDGILEGLLTACVRGGDAACSSYADGTATDVLRSTGAAVADVLRQVASRAPEAQVVLVGYLGLTPESGTCETLGLSAGSAAAAHRIEDELDTTLASSARTADVDYVSMRAASAGHDVCADEPWVNGINGLDQTDGIALHPKRVGMEAVAEQVARRLTARRR